MLSHGLVIVIVQYLQAAFAALLKDKEVRGLGGSGIASATSGAIDNKPRGSRGSSAPYSITLAGAWRLLSLNRTFHARTYTAGI